MEVFVLPRPFADEHDLGMGISFARYRVRAGFARLESTPAVGADFLGDLVQ
ncbi:MAG: hypothetical protein WED32_01865 [Patescibacteria group bacterium]